MSKENEEKNTDVSQETKVPEKTGNNHGRNPDGTFMSGVSGNPAGKPKGAKHFQTYFKLAVESVAKSKGKTYHEVMTDLATSGLINALDPKSKASFYYFQEIFDRLDGKPAQTIHNSFDDEVESVEIKIVNSRDEIKD